MRSMFMMAALACGLAPALEAQTARLSVIHGIPGLPAPVEVAANGNVLFSFDYEDVRGPIEVDAGPLAVEVRLNGTPVLTANVTLQAGVEYSAIAHLDATGNNTISLFTDDMSPIGAGNSRVSIRHTAQAPAVDVDIAQNGATVLTIPNLTNPNEAVTDVPAGAYDASLFVAGTTNLAFGPAALDLAADVSYRVYAVGDVSTTNFALIVQAIDFSPSGAHSTISAIHGIPGLPAPVEVVIDGTSAFFFNYTDIIGPVEIPSGPTTLELRLNGATVLSANVVLENAMEYSVIAHLTETGQNTVTLFEEDLSPIAAGQARVAVRHTAQAPAVDVGIDQMGANVLTIPGLTNPNSAAVDVPVGSYDATLFLAGTSTVALGPAPLTFDEDVSYQVYAIGDASAPNFTVVVQAVDFSPPFTFSTQGTACGSATIATSMMQIEEQMPFNVTLSGAGAMDSAVLFVGTDDMMFNGTPLPIDLGVIGAPGCSFYSNGFFTVGAMTDGAGAASLQFTLPEAANQFVDELFFQWTYESTNNPLGLEFTDYLELVRG